MSARVLRLALLAGLLAACAPSTTIEQSWRVPNAQIGGLQNVVTLCVSRDGALRRSAEDELARKISTGGIRATPLYSVLSDAELQDREAAKAKLLAAGFDGVVAIRLVSKEQQLQYVPGTFDHYWGPAWSAAYDPGYLYAETVVRVETSAYSLKDRQLVWSALSKTVDPEDAKEAIDEITTVASKDMRKRGVVATNAPPPAGT